MREREIRASTEALNAWDFDALAEVFHPELEHHSTWDDFRISVCAVHDVDDERAVVELRLQGRAKASGVPLDDTLAQLWTWRDDKVWRIVTYADAEEALAAAASA